MEHGLYAALAQAPENQVDPTATSASPDVAEAEKQTTGTAPSADADGADAEEREAKRRRV